MATTIGQLETKLSVRGSVSYSIEVCHQGLHKHRLVRGPDAQVVTAKVRLQAAEWDALWAKKVAAERQTTMAYRRRRKRRPEPSKLNEHCKPFAMCWHLLCLTPKPSTGRR
jgi:hypothetical protein